MNMTIQAAQRRSRLGRIAAISVAAVLVLAGCSSSGADDSAESGYEGAGEPGEPAMFSEAMEEGGDAMMMDGEMADTATANRSIIVTGGMYMTVDDPIASADRATIIVREAGGRVDARSEEAPNENYGGSAWLTLRIPSDELDDVVEDLRDLGTVNQYSTSATDVTVIVTDLEAQISTLKASTERIEALLLRAEKISDIITLEDELDRRRSELESLEAQQRGLDDQVSMSTVELSLTTEPIVIVDDSPTNFWTGLQSGWESLTAFLSGLLVAIGVVIPWLVLMALVALVVLAVVRARKSTAPHPDERSGTTDGAGHEDAVTAGGEPPSA